MGCGLGVGSQGAHRGLLMQRAAAMQVATLDSSHDGHHQGGLIAGAAARCGQPTSQAHRAVGLQGSGEPRKGGHRRAGSTSDRTVPRCLQSSASSTHSRAGPTKPSMHCAPLTRRLRPRWGRWQGQQTGRALPPPWAGAQAARACRCERCREGRVGWAADDRAPRPASARGGVPCSQTCPAAPHATTRTLRDVHAPAAPADCAYAAAGERSLPACKMEQEGTTTQGARERCISQLSAPPLPRRATPPLL